MGIKVIPLHQKGLRGGLLGLYTSRPTTYRTLVGLERLEKAKKG